MTDVAITELFNSPLETGVRSLVLLNTVYPRAFDLKELTWLDHLVVILALAAVGGYYEVLAYGPVVDGKHQWPLVNVTSSVMILVWIASTILALTVWLLAVHRKFASQKFALKTPRSIRRGASLKHGGQDVSLQA